MMAGIGTVSDHPVFNVLAWMGPMDLLSILAIALALAMDAFAVAMATSLTLNPMTRRHIFRMSFHFGLFQAMMPTLGWLAGFEIQDYISSFDHWIAFGLLAFVGGKMLREAFHEEDPGARSFDPTRGWHLVLLSVATSIDALAVGLSLAMLGNPIAQPAVIIGFVCLLMTILGMYLGRRIGQKWGPRVEILGGIILISIGAKILVEHLSS